jgi:hypothetical protein
MTNTIEDENDNWWICDSCRCKHPLRKDANECCKERFSKDGDKSKQKDNRTSIKWN